MVFLIICFFLSLCCCADIPYLTSVGAMLKGYDIIKGNPKTNFFDPGFTKQIINVGHQVPTPDHRFLIPDQYTANIWPSCVYESQSTLIETTSQYVDSLHTDVSADFKGWGVSFSASEDYHHMEKLTTNDSTKVVTSKAVCTYYQLSLEYLYMPVNLTTRFKNGVMSISRSNESSDYQQFISYFGTHLLTEGIFGSKFFIRSGFDDSSWDSFQDTKCDAKMSASASFTLWSGGVKGMSDSEKKMAQSFDSHLSFNDQIYQGSVPPKTGNFNEWANISKSNPALVRYKLISIDELLTPINFHDISNIEQVQQRLGNELSNYCQNVYGCHLPPKVSPQSCFELRTMNGVKKDGTYTAYYQRDVNKPFTVYCRNMGSKLPPLDYIPLKDFLYGRNNVCYYRGSSKPLMECVNCYFTKFEYVPIDPLTMNIRQGDFFGANTSLQNIPTNYGQVISQFEGPDAKYGCQFCKFDHIYSLQGTEFGFDDTETTQSDGLGTLQFYDQYKQIANIRAGPVPWKHGCVAKSTHYFGFSKLKYIAAAGEKN